MGSAKDLFIVKKPEINKPGNGNLAFSDRYSVFDWGRMPDNIKHKGEVHCLIGAYFFEKLEDRGIKTHYNGVIEDGGIKSLSNLKGPANIMEVKLLRLIKPEIVNGEYDYSGYRKGLVNVRIPLEIIYRNSLPEGSSVFRRLKDGKISPSDIGLNKMPHPGQKLDKPVIEVSTKLEAIDRYVSWKEAEDIAGLSEQDLIKIKNIVSTVNELITEKAGKAGVVNNDGKIEFGFDENRELVITDVVGTPDECRITYNGIPVSKELIRSFYRDTIWFNELIRAKKKYKTEWKEHVDSIPPRIPDRLAGLISEVYRSFCNELTQTKWFDVQPLKDTVLKIKREIAK